MASALEEPLGKAILEKRFPGSKQPISEPGRSLLCASIYPKGDIFHETAGSATLKQHSPVRSSHLRTGEVGIQPIRRTDILSGSGRECNDFLFFLLWRKD